MLRKLNSISINIFKIIWIVLSIMSLIYSLYIYEGKPNDEADLILVLSMLALTFPAGLLYALMFSIVADIFYKYYAVVFTVTYTSMVVSWLFLFLLGYFQWFWLLPKIIQKIKNKSGTGSH